jgi:hypothetical protein
MCKNMDLDDWISIKHIVPLCEPIARYALLLLWLRFRLAMLFRSLLPARLHQSKFCSYLRHDEARRRYYTPTH